jgi:hypothetical protein
MLSGGTGAKLGGQGERCDSAYPGREGFEFEEGKPRAGRMRKRDSRNPIPWAIGRAVRATRLGREGEDGDEEEDEQLEGGGDTVGEEVLEAGKNLARDLDGRDAHAAREGCIRRGEGKCRASVRRSKVKVGGRRTRERERRERERERGREREKGERVRKEREGERERGRATSPRSSPPPVQRERDIT